MLDQDPADPLQQPGALMALDDGLVLLAEGIVETDRAPEFRLLPGPVSLSPDRKPGTDLIDRLLTGFLMAMPNCRWLPGTDNRS